MADLIWTKKIPTEEGFYFVKVKKRDYPEYKTVCDLDYLRCWLGSGDRKECVEWAGPIPEPKEVKDV